MVACQKFKYTIISVLFLLLNLCQNLSAGELFLQKPNVYTSGKEITGWVMSEKLDGIRGYWNGEKLMTRKGVPLNPPSWFIKNFPAFELDGELWSKRGDFEFIQSTVLDKNPGNGWEKITYNIFEVPNAKGDFLKRLNKAEVWFETQKNKVIKIIPQIRIKNRSDLDLFLDAVQSKGGEGVIVKDPEMFYHTGRSVHVLKVKKFWDMEGVVIGLNKGKGKYATLMGSLTLKIENEIIFKLGTGFTDQIRKNPPPIGTIITFKYYGLTKNGTPKFASFLRVRKD
ncbi:MAG: DNA ligase [Desulfobacula sp.]|nr:DNA ligase [Desulfobacula sp.]